jgi:hypothetical protein
MLTTVKTMTEKKQGTAHKNVEKITRNTRRKKLRKNNSYFINEKENR